MGVRRAGIVSVLLVLCAAPVFAQAAKEDVAQFVTFYGDQARAEGFAPDQHTTRADRVAFLAQTVSRFCSPYLAMKRGDPTRPISDEVVVSVWPGLDYRRFWDFIRNSGASTWELLSPDDGEHLPLEQPLVNPLTLGKLNEPVQAVPTVPGCTPPTSAPPPVVVPPAPVYPGYPQNEAVLDVAGGALLADFAEAGQEPNAAMFRFAFRVAYDWMVGNVPSLEASVAKHRREWRAILGLP